MSILSTTLSTAMAETDGQANLASVTGLTGPGVNKTTRMNIWCDRECMEVSAAPVGTVVPVVRATDGTLRRPHPAGAKVWYGTEADFRAFTNEGLGLGLYSSLSRAFETTNPTTAADTATLTAAQLLGGLITGTPTAAANYTLPTPALLIAALQAFSEVFLGQSFYFTVKNTSAGANTITAVAPTGVTIVGTATVVQNNGKRFRVVLTGIDTPAYSIYSEGTVVF